MKLQERRVATDRTGKANHNTQSGNRHVPMEKSFRWRYGTSPRLHSPLPPAGSPSSAWRSTSRPFRGTPFACRPFLRGRGIPRERGALPQPCVSPHSRTKSHTSAAQAGTCRMFGPSVCSPQMHSPLKRAREGERPRGVKGAFVGSESKLGPVGFLFIGYRGQGSRRSR